MLPNLETTCENIRTRIEAKNAARDHMINVSRVLTRHCANAIRAMHRQEWENAQELLKTARDVLDQMRQRVEGYPDLYYAGYTQDSFKEYVEATLVYAMVRGEDLPTPQDLNVEDTTYLNGMAEAASELRRYVLDLLRHVHNAEVERLLTVMETIYDLLMTFDFPDALTGGLRHRVDALRAVVERTRGDVTTSLRQHQLQLALERSEQGTLRNSAEPQPPEPPTRLSFEINEDELDK